MATPSMTPEEIRQKIEQLSSDIALLRGFVHGDEQTTVPLGGEDTNSLRRFMMLAQDGVDGPIERARQWAENPEGVPVAGPGHFSALHWATKAMEGATGTADVPTASPLHRGLAPAGGLANQVYRVNADGNGYGWETGLATPARDGFVPAGGAAGQVFWVNEAGDGYEWGYIDDKTIKIINGRLTALAAPLGDIQLKPFRFDELPPGWHFCNGDLYPLSGAVGVALEGLPDNYKSDWGIVEDGENISIPNMFVDERGVFLRAGINPGTTVDDQIRPITGRIYDSNKIVGFAASGAFYTTGKGNHVSTASSGSGDKDIMLDTGRLGPNFSGTETHPLERHATPAIFLGV